MPQHISSHEAPIRTLAFQKQRIETSLAFDLLEIFNTTPSLINPLRQLASFAIDEMLSLRRDNLQERKILMNAWNKERKLQDLIKRPSWQTPQQWRQPGRRFGDPWTFLGAASANLMQLRAEECSDVVRLYGEIVEQGEAKWAKSALKELAQADHNRRFLPPRQPSALERYAELSPVMKSYRRGGEGAWGKKEGGGRQRKNLAKERRVAEGPVQDLIFAQKGGMRVWKSKDTNAVPKIDHTFGLVEGADISGTTTDNIFFIERYAALLKSQLPSVVGHLDDPIYHMLPLASIVACAHHSLLEVALAMSINAINDYRIGLYTTLMPFHSHHPAHGRIMTLLRRAETHPNNRLLVIYFQRPGVIGGCYVFNKTGLDRLRFARLAKADLEMMNTFAARRGYPNRIDTDAFMCNRLDCDLPALGIN